MFFAFVEFLIKCFPPKRVFVFIKDKIDFVHLGVEIRELSR